MTGEVVESMTTPAIFQIYARYNAWMNDNIYAGCEKLSDAQRKQDMGAFFKSIHGTLNHLLIVDRLWMARFAGKPLPSVNIKTLEKFYGSPMLHYHRITRENRTSAGTSSPRAYSTNSMTSSRRSPDSMRATTA